jgi:hypothetical protein
MLIIQCNILVISNLVNFFIVFQSCLVQYSSKKAGWGRIVSFFHINKFENKLTIKPTKK